MLHYFDLVLRLIGFLVVFIALPCFLLRLFLYRRPARRPSLPQRRCLCGRPIFPEDIEWPE